jgi:small-conductance mechanosensitive channel
VRRSRAIFRPLFVVLLTFVAVLGLFAGVARAEAPDGGVAEAKASATALVRVHERDVYVVRAPRAGQSAEARARAASQALVTILEEGEDVDVKVEEQGTTAVVFAGKTPILTLTEEDAAAAGDATLKVHAAAAASRVDEALRIERKRSQIATTVFSFSLLVFSALIAFLLVRRVGDFGARIRTWVAKHPERIPAFRLGKIEVVSRGAIRGGLAISLVIGHRLAQIAIAYTWVLVALSLFASTRAYTERLTGFVLAPLSALLGRVGAGLPLLVVTIVAAVALVVLVRFVGLFFENVARGETKLGWLPADLAEPTSVVVRAGVVVCGLIFAAPLLTGSDEGALSRLGVAVLVALGLASTPVLACAAAGVPQVFLRKVRAGDYAELGGRSGRVRRVTLLEVELEDDTGCDVRVPHLLALVRPTRIVGRAPLVSIEVSIDPRAEQNKAYDALLGAARTLSPRAQVELVSLDVRAARYKVICEPKAGLSTALTEALAREQIALGA